jgi:SAM-dependent methyltransferase
MHREDAYPLDLREAGYAYVERPNAALLALFRSHVLSRGDAPAVLDVGCGAGANARAIRRLAPSSYLVGIEPNPAAAALARAACDEVFEGAAGDWTPPDRRFDAVLLSDVVEHQVDPVAFVGQVAAHPNLGAATWLVSVPNYAVWYNRLQTLAGRFEYAHSGLYDRTHLRFFTRRSLTRLLDHCGFDVLETRCTPSLVQSAAPLLRRLFAADVAAGHHLTLDDSRAFHAYSRFVEPAETLACRGWPELLAFQHVVAARLRGA